MARTTRDARRGRTPLERFCVRFPALGHLVFRRDTYRGVEGYLEFIEQWLEAIVTNRFEIELVIDMGPNRVLGLARHYGVGVGSGAAYETRSADLHEFHKGRAVRQTFWVDREEAMRELGLDTET